MAIAGRRLRRPRPRPGVAKRAGSSFTVTFIAVVIVAAFLSPLLRSFTISLKSPDQVNELNGPVYPASPVTYNYQGKDDPVLEVPINGQTRDLAIVKKGRDSSDFIDPANPDAGHDHLAGLVADADADLHVRSPVAELRQRLERARVPEAALQHDRDRPDRDDRDARLVRARRLWLRPLPVPRPGQAVHPASSPRSSCRAR